jgi:hypothetical protein
LLAEEGNDAGADGADGDGVDDADSEDEADADDDGGDAEDVADADDADDAEARRSSEELSLFAGLLGNEAARWFVMSTNSLSTLGFVSIFLRFAEIPCEFSSGFTLRFSFSS